MKRNKGFKPSKKSVLSGGYTTPPEPRISRGVTLDFTNKSALKAIGIAVIAGIFVIVCLRGCLGSSESKSSGEASVSDKVAQSKVKQVVPQKPVLDLINPVREAPETFKRDTYYPKRREGETSGSIINGTFSAARDLVYVDDDRVWWESDNDGTSDDECDHSMHAAMEIPFRRLVNLVDKTPWQLRVQEAYRSTGIHATQSLHKQGRAVDVTMGNRGGTKIGDYAEMMKAYEQLAILAVQAGFDWVYYENSRGTGPHIHASVRADGQTMRQARGQD